MTNYDILKEYETHNTPLPSYDELQLMNEAVNQALAANAKLVKKNTKIKELLKCCQTLLYDNGFLFNPQDREKAKDVIADICEVLDD